MNIRTKCDGSKIPKRPWRKKERNWKLLKMRCTRLMLKNNICVVTFRENDINFLSQYLPELARLVHFWLDLRFSSEPYHIILSYHSYVSASFASVINTCVNKEKKRKQKGMLKRMQLSITVSHYWILILILWTKES